MKEKWKKLKMILEHKKKIRRKFFNKECRNKICYFVEKFSAFMRKKFCFTEEEIEEIQSRVEETKNRAEKFEVVEQKIPDFFEAANRLQNENDELRNDNTFLIMKVQELFDADRDNNYAKRIRIYEELGFSFDENVAHFLERIKQNLV